MAFYISVTILILALGAQLTLRSFVKRGAARDVIPSGSEGSRDSSPESWRAQNDSVFRHPESFDKTQDKLREGSRDSSDFALRMTKKSEKIFQWIFFGAVVLIFTNSFYLSYSQYKIWKYGPMAEFTKLFLPPYQNISYFIGYSLFYFFASHLISLIFAILFFKAAKYYNKKYEEKFFYFEEYYLGASAIFLSGFPGIFFYIITLFLVSVLGSFILNKFSTLKGQRLSFYYLWIPVAIFVIIISRYFEHLKVWQMFKI